MKKLTPEELKKIKNLDTSYENLYYIGNINLLYKKKIAIVGSRHPNSYAKQYIAKISEKLSQNNICIVSGGAMGIDAIAHKSAGVANTIMVAGTGVDKRYPKINEKLIQDIETQGLVISQFEPNTPSYPRNFAIRNRLIVNLADVLIVGYADLKSGTMRSVEYALKMSKPIYVLPHRIEQSDGTNKLLEQGKAKAIYDIDKFVSLFGNVKSNNIQDEFLEYCKTNPTYDEAVIKYASKVFEYELMGKIEVKDGLIYS